MRDTGDELTAALGGDAAAMRRLCTSLYPTVQHSVAAMLRYRGPSSTLEQERDDLVQEVFRYLLDNDARPLRLWDPQRAGGRTLKSWVALIAGRHAGRVASRRAARAHEEPATDIEDAQLAEPIAFSDELLNRDLLGRLLDRIEAELNEDDLRLFEAIFVHVRAATEVAQALGVPANTIHKRCQRLRVRVTAIADELAAEGQPAVAILALLLLAGV